MEILKLIHIDGFLDGGSSRPLAITAMDKHGNVKQYVMKLFKRKYVMENYSVAKEILVNELAKEFSLPVPDYALIDIDHKLLVDFFKPEDLELLDDGYKFCSEFNPHYVIFSPVISFKFLKDYDIANLFAFDNVIINTDRGGYRNKPNLLIKDDDMLLIDHEQTLPFINNQDNEPNYFSYLLHYPHQIHIAATYLKALRVKNGVFDEFFESLRMLNINRFIPIFDQMEFYNIAFCEREDFFLYLEFIKNKREAIVKHLNSIIK